MYDVIIVGGGPTGATAGKILAEKGFSVLIVERCKLPRYKSCSGMVIRKTIDDVDKYFDCQIPDYVKCTPFDNYGMVFVNDEGKEYKFEQRGYNVWRSSFDNFLLEKAIENGAKVIDRASVTSCECKDDFVEVTISHKTIRTEKARYLIDCEGATGTLKRSIFGNDKDYITTYQAFYNGTINLDPHYFYAYLQPTLSEYDAWFNVKDNMLVLGVAVKDPSKINTYYTNFIDYMKSNHGLILQDKVKEEKWIMPRIRPDFKINYGTNRILLAGEVAGFLNPMGEGISCGIESGYACAMAIADNFNNSENVLPCYRKYSAETLAYMKRQWHLVALMSNRFEDMKNNS
ncbi:MAG: NAD(P)/FAD-dependent oxidoreductase [Clostridiales bacterium]|nr:NAD(P)/FAD-dependent oxidoreductase [Clostridiales bacterium]